MSKIEKAKMMQAINTISKLDLKAAKAELQMQYEETCKEAMDNHFQSQENMHLSVGLICGGNGSSDVVWWDLYFKIFMVMFITYLTFQLIHFLVNSP